MDRNNVKQLSSETLVYFAIWVYKNRVHICQFMINNVVFALSMYAFKDIFTNSFRPFSPTLHIASILWLINNYVKQLLKNCKSEIFFVSWYQNQRYTLATNHQEQNLKNALKIIWTFEEHTIQNYTMKNWKHVLLCLLNLI